MGLLDSIFRTAVRRTVSKVVDHAVDEAIGNMKNNNQPAQPQVQAQPQNRTCTIFKPNLSGNLVKHDGLSAYGDKDVRYVFELPDKMFEKDSGAAEVPVYYVVANNRDEFEEYIDELESPHPDLHIDESGSYIGFIQKNGKNVVVSKVENHNLIVEKYEYDTTSEYINKGKISHHISYIFYNSQADRNHCCECALTLSYNDTMNQDLCGYAIQALNFIASTLRLEERIIED